MRQTTIASILLLVLVTGCRPSEQERLDANKNLVRQMAATIDAANWDGLDASVSADLHRHGPTTGKNREITSLEEFKKLEQAYHEGFPDMRVRYEKMVAQGDMVAAYGTFTGTNTGWLTMANAPATGRPVQMKLSAMFRIEENKIAEIWIVSDRLSLMKQLGLLPAPASTDK